MNHQQFWNLFKEFVIFHPPNLERPCLQLQTWALLKNFEANLNDEGLGMTMRDKGKPTFFARKWAESGYQPNAVRADGPFLVANMVDISAEFSGKARTEFITFDLAVLDKLQDPKVRPTLCNGRSEQDIFKDAWDMLTQVFTYLSTVVEATVTPLVGAPYVQVTAKAHLDALVSNSAITSFLVGENETRQLQRDFHKMVQNKAIKGLPWRGGIGSLHGMYVPELVFQIRDCPVPGDLNFVEYNREVSEQERCC